MSLNSLKQNFKGQIITDQASLEKYSTDASIFRIEPSTIVVPQDVEDIKQLVKFVINHKATSPELSLTVRGGGTDMTGGSINDSIIIDTVNLNRITQLTDISVQTQPGTFYRDLEPKLLSKNLVLPCYPSSKALCTLGGMMANNAGGEKTFKYGQCINYVLELDAILADGNEYHIKPLSKAELELKLSQNDFEGKLYKQIWELINDNYKLIQTAKPTTSKNASGYYLWDVWDGHRFDLGKLFVGSQGTLGIITNIKWRLVPLQRYRQLAIFYLNDLNQLGKIVTHVNELNPESFEIFDKETFRTALRYLPEMAQKTKYNSLTLAWKFKKEIYKWLTGRLPEIVLLAEFTAPTQTEAINKARQAADNINQHFNLRARLAVDQAEANRFWSIRRESYNLLREHNARKISAPFIEDIVVHPEQLPEFMPKVNAIIAKYPEFTYTIAGHAGDANFHIIPLVDLSNEKTRARLVQLSDEVFDLVLKYKGSMTAEHNDGLVRGPFLKHMHGEKVYELFRRVKQIFDPQNIFNPHKKTEATLEYYRDHMRSY